MGANPENNTFPIVVNHKIRHPADNYIFTVNSIIDFGIASSYPVYHCSIRASNVFDRILLASFHKLIKKMFQPVLFDFLWLGIAHMNVL